MSGLAHNRRKWSVCATISSFVLLSFVFTSRAEAMQIGAVSVDSGYADSTSSKLSEPASFVNGQQARTYWLATTFNDGIFFQAGYVDASNGWGSDSCQTGFGTFETALDSSGSVFPDLYNLGNCGLTGSQWFRLKIVAEASGNVTWRWWHNSTYFGPQLDLPNTQDHFPRDKIGPITEFVDTHNAPSATPFPTEVYNSAMLYEPVNGTQLFDTQHAKFQATMDRTCFYALRVLGADAFETGTQSNINPTYCHTPGDSLW